MPEWGSLLLWERQIANAQIQCKETGLGSRYRRSKSSPSTLVWKSRAPSHATTARYVLIVLDYFSRFVWAKTCVSAGVFNFWIYILVPFYGCLYTDNASHLVGVEMVSLFESYGVDVMMTFSFAPSSSRRCTEAARIYLVSRPQWHALINNSQSSSSMIPNSHSSSSGMPSTHLKENRLPYRSRKLIRTTDIVRHPMHFVVEGHRSVGVGVSFGMGIVMTI